MKEPEELMALESPPTGAGTRGVPFAVPTASGDWTALLPAGLAPTAACYVTIYNPTAGQLLFGFDGTTAVSANGFPIGAGQSKRFWVIPVKHKFVMASGAGAFMYVSSFDNYVVSP